MQVSISIIALLISAATLAQGFGRPFCVWEDQNTGLYYLSQLDASTGSLTQIDEIPGLEFFVLGNTSAYSTTTDHYHFMGHDGSNKRLYTIQASTGTLLANHIVNDNIVGIESNCADSSLYGLREINDNYDLVELGGLSGTVTSIGPIPNVDGYVSESFVLAQGQGLYTFIALDAGVFRLRSYSITDASLVHDHPFPDNLTGLEYNCQDSSIYALWENGPDYDLERINLNNGTHSTVASLNGVTPGFIPSSSSMHEDGYYTYRGFNTNNAISLFTIDVETGSVVYASPTTDNATGFQEGMCCAGSSPVGIEATTLTENLSVYPNPASSLLQITGHQPLEQISVYSITGELVIEVVVPSHRMGRSVDVGRISNGTYLLKATTVKGEPLLHRLVIAR